MGFTAGQQAYSDFFELTAREEHVKQLENESIEQGVACKKIKDGDYSVCFVICTRYNFWEECTHHPGQPSALSFLKTDFVSNPIRFGFVGFLSGSSLTRRQRLSHSNFEFSNGQRAGSRKSLKGPSMVQP